MRQVEKGLVVASALAPGAVLAPVGSGVPNSHTLRVALALALAPLAVRALARSERHLVLSSHTLQETAAAAALTAAIPAAVVMALAGPDMKPLVAWLPRQLRSHLLKHQLLQDYTAKWHRQWALLHRKTCRLQRRRWL